MLIDLHQAHLSSIHDIVWCDLRVLWGPGKYELICQSVCRIPPSNRRSIPLSRYFLPTYVQRRPLRGSKSSRPHCSNNNSTSAALLRDHRTMSEEAASTSGSSGGKEKEYVLNADGSILVDHKGVSRVFGAAAATVKIVVIVGAVNCIEPTVL